MKVVTLFLTMLFLLSTLVLATSYESCDDCNLYKQNECVQIKKTLNATSLNISSISYPNSTIVYINDVMTKNGLTFNYSFCDTNVSGVYLYDLYDEKGNVYNDWFEITLSGEQRDKTILISDIVLLLAVISILLFITMKHKETNFEDWDKNIIKNHKNLGQTFATGILYSLFKNSFIWLYFLGWICVLIVQDIVYRFNSSIVYNYFTIFANVYSLGLLLVTVFFIGMTVSYIRGVIEILAENNWGLGNEE